ncbi:putative DNA replication complex GINS protein SLD5 [Hibiscus syriacus]|uniref:DNA replication complex GINS protein SLD5 n=1 Tax=Hibiscus syriacus TaxID=106335 RepID=A0A6A2YC19_HIBSY|nr:putative DNA replication complex GINS protein SLD5 [Hibiscus syriacus]
MEDVFKVMDKDGDGRLSHEDLKSYMKWAGFSASDEDIKAMIRFGGGDGDNGVTFHGLLNILAVDFSG